MTREEALRYAIDNYPFDSNEYERGYCTVVRLRKCAEILPEFGVDGSVRDESTWAYMDMTAKVDTGIYGDIYYFSDMKRAQVWVKE